MAPLDTSVRQVNNILQNLRGEHFRHAQNVQGKRAVSNNSFGNGPTLPVDLIYPSSTTGPVPPSWRAPGPSPPKSWQFPSRLPDTAAPVIDADVPCNSPAWRQRALSLLFSADPIPSHPIYPDPDPSPTNHILIPSLTFLCLQLVRTYLADDLSHDLPPHLRRALVRHAAVHAPLSQTELNALRQGATHIDAELIVVGPGNVLRPNFFHQRRRREHAFDTLDPTDSADDDGDAVNDAWDAVQMQDSEASELRSLAVLLSPLSAATLLAFPPTITHLALLGVPHRIPLQRLPTICPLLVFLDLSYNSWLSVQMLEGEVTWGKLRRLEIVGLRQCPVTPKVLLELNRGRWEDVRVVIQ